VTVQGQFRRKFYRQQAPVPSAVNSLAQKFELTGSVCDNSKGVGGKPQVNTHTQENTARVREAPLRNQRKSVTRCSQ